MLTAFESFVQSSQYAETIHKLFDRRHRGSRRRRRTVARSMSACAKLQRVHNSGSWSLKCSELVSPAHSYCSESSLLQTRQTIVPRHRITCRNIIHPSPRSALHPRSPPFQSLPVLGPGTVAHSHATPAVARASPSRAGTSAHPVDRKTGPAGDVSG